MNATNKVQLTGNLGRDPETKTFEDGNKVVRFSMATSEEYYSKGEKKTGTSWHSVTARGKVADRIAGELKKGAFISVEGRLQNRNYTDKEGQKKYITEIVVGDYSLLEKA